MPTPVPRLEAETLARDFRQRFGNDALPAARAMRQYMVQNRQADRARVYEELVKLLQGLG